MLSPSHWSDPPPPTPAGLRRPESVPPDQRSRVDLLERLTALEHRLATMARLEQAKGALMVVYGLTEDAADALLSWYSRTRHIDVNDIAEGLTAQAEPEPLCESATQQLTLMLDRITAPSPDAADANDAFHYRPGITRQRAR